LNAKIDRSHPQDNRNLPTFPTLGTAYAAGLSLGSKFKTSNGRIYTLTPEGVSTEDSLPLI